MKMSFKPGDAIRAMNSALGKSKQLPGKISSGVKKIINGAISETDYLLTPKPKMPAPKQKMNDNSEPGRIINNQKMLRDELK